jgi:hypothetical protein
MTKTPTTPISKLAEQFAWPQGLPPASDPREALRLEWITPEKLLIDASYQRLVSDTGKRRLQRMVKTFDWRRFGALQVAELDDGSGRYAVMDGQHRGLVAWAMQATVVPCIVAQAGMRDQAVAFVGINTERGSVAPIDKFRARVAAGDEAACTVAEILTELEISTEVAPGYRLKPKQTRAVGNLEKLVKQIGRGLTFTTLELLTDAQPDQDNLLTNFAVMVTGRAVARIVEAEGDLDRLERVVAETDFETLAEQAKQLMKLQGGQLATHGTQQLLRAYNRGLQQKVA